MSGKSANELSIETEALYGSDHNLNDLGTLELLASNTSVDKEHREYFAFLTRLIKTGVTSHHYSVYVEDKVIPVINSFCNSELLSSKGKSMLVSWGRSLHTPDRDLFSESIAQVDIDIPGTDALRVFFTKSGNRVANASLPQLIFSRNTAGQLQVYSSLRMNQKPSLLKETAIYSEIERSHIEGFLVNQLNGQDE